ncbi:MAG: immunoglobulin domain-containing protein [Bacteroidota bacterium]
MAKNILLFSFCVLLSIGMLAQNKATADDRWDNQFNAGNAPDNVVRTIATDGNIIYAGGEFLNVAGQSIQYLAKYDGTSWTSFGSGINGIVYDILIDGTKIYVGGSFTSIGGISADNIAMWDGTSWNTLGVGITGTVYCLAKNDNYLFVGGDIINAGGMPVNNIATWDETSWNTLSLGMNSYVYAIEVSGTDLYAGGDFTDASGVANTSYIAHWNGSAWNSLGNGLDGTVNSIYESSGSLYVGGNFMNSGTTTVTRIAKWYSGSWYPVGTGADGIIYSIKEFNGNVYFAGDYSTIDGVSSSNISSYNSIIFSSLGTGISGPVYDICTTDFELWAGGDFNTAGINPSINIARWMSPPSIIIHPVNANPCINDTVTFFIDADGTTPFTYQWKFNGSDLIGATDSFYTIYGVIPPDAGNYKCVVMNASDTVSTNTASLVVHLPPVITLNPVDQEKCEGEFVSFSIIASTTTTMTYQWQVDGVDIPSGTTSVLSKPSVALADTGVFLCIVTNTCGSDTSDEAELIVHPLPVVYFTGLDLDYCTNDQKDTLAPFPSGGIFSGAGMNDSIFNPVGLLGTFTINYVFTDTNGCISDFDKDVTIHGLPVANFTGLNANYCVNDLNSVLSGTPVGGIFIGQGITGNTFYPDSAGPGTYDITYFYMDNNGCTDTDIHVVEVYEIPGIFVGNDTSICLGDVLTITMTGDFGMYGWFFTPDLFTVLDVYPVSDTSYAGWIMNTNGCLAIDTISVIVNQLPTGVSFSGLDTEYCNFAEADTLIGIPDGGIFLDSSVVGNVFYPGYLTSGIYDIVYQYTDSNGCSDYDTNSVYIKPVTNVSFTGLDAQYCLNNTVDTLIGIPVGGTFSGGNIVGYVFDPQIAGTGVHEIIYEYLDTNACYAYDTISTLVLSVPDISLGQDTGICTGDSLVIYATSSSALYYYWNITGNSDSIYVSPLSDTYYIVTVSDGNCENSDSIFVESHPYPEVDLGDNRDLCEGEYLNAGGGQEIYFWIPAGSDSIMPIIQSGTYSVTVTSYYGCITSDAVQITVLPTPEIDLGNDITITTDNVIILGGGGNYNSYLWNTGDSTSLIAIDGSLLGYGQYTYWLVAFNSNGCFDTDTIIITVNYGLGVEDQIPEGFIISPVPANSIITVESQTEISLIEIFDVYGKTIIQQNVSGKSQIIDITTLSDGIYFIHVKGEGLNEIRKLLKQ